MINSERIPLVDLKAQYISLKDEIDFAISQCVEDNNFIRGKSVGSFEDDFAKYIGAKFCVGCGNGTDALEIILRSLNINAGDEVIVPALTWIATAEAVNNVGAEPVFVDINPENYTIDTTRIKAKITKKTKAIIPVHLYGSPADMTEIMTIAGEHGLFVIEDCAQAHGAEYKGKKIGTFGIASAFSFFPSKNLGAFGDAGAIISNNKEVAERSRMFTNHGQLAERHLHSIIGRNSRLDTIQAAILSVKLPFLDKWNESRRGAANIYMSDLKTSSGLILPLFENDKKHVFHLFVIRTQIRERLITALNGDNISCGIHYPKALPFLDAYLYKKHKTSDFPVSSNFTNEILSIPVYPEITQDQVSRICRIINNCK
ncbi:MAG: DegT/DnrJ/EryC1/StrS family aminotransferase [Bacteroidales bacterium]|nr:DegT/DnrJ/EryC1/StrS family aminotransferase [Bacteroidales bacterium]